MISSNDVLIFVTSKDQESKHKVTSNVNKIVAELNIKATPEIVIIEKTPPGQALTIKEGLLNSDLKIIDEAAYVINSDQVVFFDQDLIEPDRCSVGLYFNDTASSCFFDLDIHNQLVTEIKEKTKISCYASAGVFYFNTVKNMIECIEWGEKNNKYYNNELYLGPCMQYFKDLSYFQTILKFDLGNTKKIELFKKFSEQLITTGV
tara:strand:- start:80 stop:694 length:615 start_codon:yes stop_codon:yes gene_type:complete